MMKKILFLFLYTFFAGTLYSQSLSGYIRDINSQPIASAYIIIDGKTHASSDDKGFYSFKSANPRSRVVVKCMGYEDYKTSVPANGKLNIVLLEKTNYINTLVVTGTRTSRMLKNTPVLTKLVTSEELHKTGATDGLEALSSMLPGVYFNPNPMGDNLQIQGLANNYILVLVDGERLVGERGENVNFSRINVEDIERIEILNGSASALYGSNAIGSVINFITKKNKKAFSAYAQARYSKYQTISSDLGVAFKHKKLSSKTNFNYKTSKGYDLTPQSPQHYTMDPSYDFSIAQNFAYAFNDKLSAELRGVYYQREILNPPLSTNNTHYLYRNHTLGAKINYSPTEKHLLAASAFTDIFFHDKVLELINNEIERRSDNSNSAFRITDAFSLNENVNIVSGYEYDLERLYSTVLLGSGPHEKSSYNHNLFSQGNIKFLKQFEAVAGLRFTSHSGFGSHLSPSLSLMYKFKNIRIRGGLKHGFKAPTVKEMYYNFDMAGIADIIGNPNLRPESSWYKSLSFEYIEDKLDFSCSFFHNKIKDKINIVFRVVDIDGFERNQMHHANVDGARIVGMDANVQWRFLNSFAFKASYLYANAIDLSTNLQIGGNSKHNITSSLIFNYSKLKIKDKAYPFSISILGRYASPRIYEVAGGSGGGEPQISYSNSRPLSLFSVVYTQEIPFNKCKAEIQLGVKNLFNNVDKQGITSMDLGRRLELMTRITF